MPEERSSASSRTAIRGRHPLPHLRDSPSPPVGAERVGVRWGSRRSEERRDPPHPPIASAMGPSLSPASGRRGRKAHDNRDTG
jgi:hypothetical protein